MLITLEILKAKNACRDQIELFQETFGDAVEVTQENCLKAARASLDFGCLLDRKQRAAYEVAKAPLWAAYREAEAPLLAAYEEAEAPLLAAYEEAKAPLWAAYEEAEAPLLAAYEEARAIAFYNATKI